MSISQNELIIDEVLKADDLNNPQEPINRLGNGDRNAVASKPKKQRQPAHAGAKPTAISRERSIPPPTPFLSGREVAKRYSVSRPTIWRWVKEIVDFLEPVKIAKGTTRRQRARALQCLQKHGVDLGGNWLATIDRCRPTDFSRSRAGQVPCRATCSF